MTSFRISTPGKVILFGEHAVVYGKTALAASLNLRSILDFTELPDEDVSIHIEMSKLDLAKKINVNRVQEVLFNSNFPNLNNDGHEKFLQAIRDFVETIGYNDPRQKNSLECFFYALIQVAQEHDLKLRAFKLKMDTELSIGAGAGSSASFAVCLVAAFLRWSQLQSDPKAPSKFDTASLEKISKYALNCEKIMHGAPSGIDNSICTFGSVINFRKGEPPKFIPLGLRSLKILLVDTKVGRSTKILVDRFAALKSKYPEIVNRVLESIDNICKNVIDIIIQMHTITDENDRLLEAYKELSVLIDMNQGLLSTCQVSHISLDLICTSAKKYGFSAKLTGAGGGGFAYVLIPPDAPSNKVQSLNAELTTSGFSVIETELGGSGVEIHDACFTKV